MNISLIKGQFLPGEAIEIMAQMVHVKIRYHENKIGQESNEEDIKYREAKIKQLQKDLYELRKHLLNKTNKVQLEATITMEEK